VVLRDDPKNLRIDDAEVVGDGRRELREFLRHGFPQEREHRLGVIAEFCETIAVRDVFVHHEPEPFDWVEMRTVGRHEVQAPAISAMLPCCESSATCRMI
jgi:hypothetical protein